MERIIYINNLHPDVDVYILCNEFRSYGCILSASVDYDENFTSLCKGQIFFQNPSSAKSATKMNRVDLMGKPLIVKLGTSKIKSSNKNYTKIFVKNVDLDWDDCDLMKQFEKFGEISDTQISMTDGKSNGYGFVNFNRHASAKKAVEEMSDKAVAGKVLKVEPYLPKELRDSLNANSMDHVKNLLDKSLQLNNLHVKNLPKNMNETEFKSLFEGFGEVTSIKIARNEKRESKGFGFVAFKSEKDAEVARFRMNGYSLGSHILEVNFNQRREQRHQYLQLLKSEPQITNHNKKPSHMKNVNSHFSEPIFSFTAKKR